MARGIRGRVRRDNGSVLFALRGLPSAVRALADSSPGDATFVARTLLVMQLKAGDQAPAFALPDEEGKVVSTKDLKGKRYVVYFYPKDDTPGCTTEACQFTDNFPAFENLGVPVLGISADDAKSHQAFRKKYNLRVRLLSDPARTAHNAYGAWGERPGRGEGVIRSTFLVGKDGRVEKAWYFVKPDGHALEVLKELQ